MRQLVSLLTLLLLSACSLDRSALLEATDGASDASRLDSAEPDTSVPDGATPPDGAPRPDSAAPPPRDSSLPPEDTAPPGMDATPDTAPTDGGPPDTAPPPPPPDTSPPPTWTVIETMTISTLSVGPTTSSTTLTSGTTYRLRATGTAWVATGTYGVDAEYWDFADPKNGTSSADQGIAIDDSAVDTDMQPDWGPYDPSHRYVVNWPGRDMPIRAYFIDGFYGNNSGSLTLEILELR